MTELCAYVLERIREGPDFTLYRGRQPIAGPRSGTRWGLPQSHRRLEHHYSLAAELDSEWAAKPLGAQSS